MAKVKAFYKDDKVWRMMKKNLRANKSQINIGWTQGQRYGEDNNFLPMAQVAQWVEEGHRGGGMFGGKTPPRPVIRLQFIPTVAESGILQKMAIPWMHSVAMGKMSWETLHRNIAPTLLREFKYTLEVYSLVPNAPATVAYKGFNDPWKETGQLISNANFEIAKYKATSYKKRYSIFTGPIQKF